MSDEGARTAARPQELEVRGHLTLPGVHLLSYTVQEESLSLHLRAELSRQEVARVLSHIVEATRGGYFVPTAVGDVRTLASVESVLSRRGTTRFLLRTPKERAVAESCFALAGSKRPLTVAIGIPKEAPAPGAREDALPDLLARAAASMGQRPERLLEQLTTFKGRQGRQVPGKRDLAQLSEAQRRVVRDRLRRVLDAVGAAAPVAQEGV